MLILINHIIFISQFSTEYGGTQPPFDNTIWRQKILNNADYFLRLESFHEEREIKENIDICDNQQARSDGEDVDDDEIFYEAADEGDNKSLEVDLDGISEQFLDTETEDSEEYDSDRILSPKHNCKPIHSLEEVFLKLNEHETRDAEI